LIQQVDVESLKENLRELDVFDGQQHKPLKLFGDTKIKGCNEQKMPIHLKEND